jgi:hypothetical protein
MYSATNVFDFLSLLPTNIFYGCESLNTIVFESKNKNTILLSDYITELGESVFENCKRIDDVFIDMNVNNIPKNTFKNCSNMSNVYFKENQNILAINESAFDNCSNLNNLELPIKLESIGHNSFNNCSKLDKLIVYNNNNINIQSTSFTGILQFNQTNNAVIFTDNISVKNYFTTTFPKSKQVQLNAIDTFNSYFYTISNLFDNNYILTKQYFYPSLDVKLTASRQIVTSDLVNSLISVDKLAIFRHLILEFIFEINKSYNNFVINNQKIRLTTPIGSQSSYFMTVYNSASRNIDTAQDITVNNYLAIYGLLQNNYSEVLINNYKVRLSIGSNNKYNLEYSTNNFDSYTQLLINSNSNTTANITNYSFLTGDYNDYIIYKDIISAPLSLYIEGLQLSITASLSEQLTGSSTTPMVADAYTKLDIPLSVVANTFMYWSDGINVDNVVSDGIKFKTVNYSGWENVYLARAITNSAFGGIQYYRPSSVMAKNEIKYDFIRYLAKNIFKTSAGVDIFKNNEQATAYIENNAQTALTNRLRILENLGEFTNEETIDNIAGSIFRQIILQQPNRIVPNDGDWTPMNLYADDKIYIKLIIHPEPNQHKILNPNNNIQISSRSYLIELNLTSG